MRMDSSAGPHKSIPTEKKCSPHHEAEHIQTMMQTYACTFTLVCLRAVVTTQPCLPRIFCAFNQKWYNKKLVASGIIIGRPMVGCCDCDVDCNYNISWVSPLSITSCQLHSPEGRHIDRLLFCLRPPGGHDHPTKGGFNNLRLINRPLITLCTQKADKVTI